MKAPLPRAALLLVLASALCGAAPPGASGDPPFGSYWHDGKAEIDGYRYTLTRYGQPRQGQCVAVYVTEPFSRSKNVKADDPARNPADTFDVLKLNLVRDFQTGIYDYNTMTSLFVRSSDFEPVKVSFSSTEWCGNVYEELRVDPGLVSQRLSSYFEDESGTREERRPKDGILEEELFVRLRGLAGEYLAPGARRTVPFLPGAFRRRLTHAPLHWEEATIQRLAEPQTLSVPAGRFQTTVYSVAIANGAQGLFFVEAAYPHRIVRWEWKPAAGAHATRAGPGTGFGADSNDAGELSGSERLQYWKLHNVGDERYLRSVGLLPGVPTPGAAVSGKPAVPKSP
jgi:hypothetical protein